MKPNINNKINVLLFNYHNRRTHSRNLRFYATFIFKDASFHTGMCNNSAETKTKKDQVNSNECKRNTLQLNIMGTF